MGLFDVIGVSMWVFKTGKVMLMMSLGLSLHNHTNLELWDLTADNEKTKRLKHLAKSTIVHCLPYLIVKFLMIKRSIPTLLTWLQLSLKFSFCCTAANHRFDQSSVTQSVVLRYHHPLCRWLEIIGGSSGKESNVIFVGVSWNFYWTAPSFEKWQQSLIRQHWLHGLTETKPEIYCSVS